MLRKDYEYEGVMNYLRFINGFAWAGLDLLEG
jgi:hypothetical protein